MNFFIFSHKDTVVKLSLEISNVAILQKSVAILQKQKNHPYNIV